MCDLFECQSYASLFGERVKKEKKAIAILFSLALLSFFIGLLLLVFALVLGDLQGNLRMEILKTALGLIASGASVASWKEVLGRWVSLVPFTNLNDRLTNCDTLSSAQMDVTCELAKAFLSKF